MFSKIHQRRHTKEKILQSKTNAIEMGKKLELSEKDHLILNKYCKKKKIKYLTTFHDLQNFKSHKLFKLDYIKIGSGDINNLPYLEEASKIKTKVILSTGLSYLNEVRQAISILTKYKLKKKTL